MNVEVPERKPTTEEISGLIERVTFHNDDSGFCVLRVKIKGQREETTVVGSLPSVNSFLTAVAPITTTRAEVDVSVSSMKRPALRLQFRTSVQVAVTPLTDILSLLPSATTFAVTL